MALAHWLDVVLAALAVSCLLLMLAGSLSAMTRLVALQGFLIAGVPLIARWGEWDVALLAVAFGNLLVKGVAFPLIIGWTARRIRLTVRPERGLGEMAALVTGLLFFAGALWLGSRLEPPGGTTSSLAVPVALLMTTTGLYLIVARRSALSQVAGYLVLENGIFTFGTSVAFEQAVIVELGILLDIFAAVFVMGITVYQIGRTFDSIDVSELTELKDTRR